MFSEHVLDDCRTAAYCTFSRSDIRNSRASYSNKSLTLPFSTEFVLIRPILCQLVINLIFNFKNTIKNFLIHNQPRDEDSNLVYIVPCGQCPSVYLGQTGKSLSLRVKQHKYSVRTNQINNGISNHANKTLHSINWEGVTAIQKCKSYQERLIIESCLIAAANPNRIMNLHPGEFRIDPVLVEEVAPLVLGGVHDPNILRCFI